MTHAGTPITGDQWESTNAAMLELAQRLKREYRLERLIDDAAERHNVALTPGALLVLVTPLVEAALAQSYRNSIGIVDTQLEASSETVARSVDQLLAEVAAEPARADRVPEELAGIERETGRRVPMRTSISVVKAFSRRFCKIPPFCGE